MSFAMKKIPVIFLWSGMHADYHRPTDTVDKINFLGIAETVDLCATLVHELASAPREQYVDTFDSHGGGGMSGMRVRLGIMPDYNSDPTIVGVRVAGASPDSPAAKAGLREGDVIVAIDADKIQSLGDYMTVLGKHKPGDVIKVTIERDKKRAELSATLADPKG
jgi:S1-C subfamily serine protease